ncbi:MAG: HD domain-containing protein [Patescibacteria group bacterium]
MGKTLKIPSEIISLAEKLNQAGFSVYLVGGCVRDLLLKREPKDWDIATNALPAQIQKIFPDSVYENQFGTVGIKTKSGNFSLKIIEITTFRIEGKYSDKRHPDKIKFSQTIEQDLARRDFTINAIALNLAELKELEIGNSLAAPDFAQREKLEINLVDPYNGQEDLKNKIIKAVGDPNQRFQEDALRLIRAVRFAVEIGFTIEKQTEQAIKKNAGLLKIIAKERIRDELVKILMIREAKTGIELLEKMNLLESIMPELRQGIGISQNLHHIYSVWEHNLLSLDYAAKKDFSLELRLAALLHDVGKPKTKRGQGKYATFHGHEAVGAKMAKIILTRLCFPKELINKVVHLVRYHLFYYNVGEVTEAGVRRFISRVGIENIDDLIKLRQADRIGSGVPKAVPYKLRHLLFMIEKVRRDPVSAKMLKIDGNQIIEILKIPPGPKIGWILAILLDEAMEDPKKNTGNYLEERVKQLGELTDKELEKMAQSARERKEEFESGVEAKMKSKFYVK